jgi:hypothetical protein
MRVAITAARPTNKGALMIAIIVFLTDRLRMRALVRLNHFCKEPGLTLFVIWLSFHY